MKIKLPSGDTFTVFLISDGKRVLSIEINIQGVIIKLSRADWAFLTGYIEGSLSGR